MKQLINIHYLLSILFFLLLSTGCNLLEVDNPNSLVEEDLNNPAAASSIANGAEATLTGAMGDLLAAYSAATDELLWIGTRDSWQELDQGKLDNPLNEFTDNAFAQVSEARWTADNAIERLEGFESAGQLNNPQPLVRSYLYGALSYITIAGAFDNFVIGNRQEPSPPVGKTGMDSLYTTAIRYLDEGLALAAGNSPWRARLLAVRARAHFERGLWQKLNPEVNTTDPLVASAEAAAGARAALAAVGESDWRYQLEITSETSGNTLAFQVNERLEMRIGNAFIVPTDDNTKAKSVRLQDPIDDIPAPYLVSRIDAFVSANQYSNIDISSARELHLIIAEDALARDDRDAFTDAINRLRALDGLTPYRGQLPPAELLRHTRQVNLFLQGRRLADLYRFGQSSPEWIASRVTPGVFIPITITEIRANPNVNLGE
jgi:hypothetical protein